MKPFGSPKSVVQYIARYTHKISSSNNCIQSITNQNMTFTNEDFEKNRFKKQMTLTLEEFIFKFALHIFFKRFVKIRYYGFLSSTWKRQKLKLLLEKLQIQPVVKVDTVSKIRKCQYCKTGNLYTILVFDQ